MKCFPSPFFWKFLLYCNYQFNKLLTIGFSHIYRFSLSIALLMWSLTCGCFFCFNSLEWTCSPNRQLVGTGQTTSTLLRYILMTSRWFWINSNTKRDHNLDHETAQQRVCDVKQWAVTGKTCAVCLFIYTSINDCAFIIRLSSNSKNNVINYMLCD